MQRWNSGSQGSGVRLCSLPPLVSISSSKKYPTKLMFQLETIWSLPSNVVHISNTVCIFYSNIQNKRSFRCWPERIPSAASCEATSLDLESPASASALCQVHSGTAARLMQWVGEKGEKKEATIPPVSRTSIRQQAPARQRTAKPEVCSQSPAIQTPLIAQDSSSSLSSSCSII